MNRHRTIVLAAFALACWNALPARAATPTLHEDVPMRDGTTLSTDVFLPGGDAVTGHPVILRRTPYEIGRAHV